MARPWWQLRSMCNDDSFPSVTFPALVAGRYVLVSTENGFLLSEEARDSAKTAIVVVERDTKARLEVGTECAFDVRVNDREMEKGASTVLKVDDRIRLGDRSYGLKRLSCPIGELRASMRKVIQCSICLRSCQDPRLLRCGHSFCSPCISQMIELAMVAAPDDNRFEHLHAIVDVDEQELLQQMRSIKCGVCRQSFTCWEALRAYHPVALVQTLEMMKEWVDFDETRPKCATCQDSRCMVDLRDYEYCEDCRMILCPVCALEGHREHRLRERKDIVATMHENGKRLTSMNMELERLRNMKKVTLGKMDECQIEFMRQATQMSITVSNAVGRCRNMISQAEPRMQPFATIDQQLMGNFDDAVKNSQAAIDEMDEIVQRFERILLEIRTMLPPQPMEMI